MKLVIFKSQVCPKCMQLSRILNTLDTVPFEEYDEETGYDLATKYSINVVPTTILVDDEYEEIARFYGVKKKNEIEEFFRGSK